MEKITLTCPLTGNDFTALRMANGSVIATNPITRKEVRMIYDAETNTYSINADDVRYIPLCTYADAVKILGISIQRISKLCKDGTLVAYRLTNNQKRIDKDSVLNYKKNRKVGAPKKEG